MKLYKITNFVDKTFLTISCILINFVWLRYFVIDNVACLVASSVVGVFISKFIIYLSDKKHQKKLITNKTLQDINDCALSLSIMTKQESIEFFNNILSTTHQTCIKDDLIYTSTNNQVIAFLPYYHHNLLTNQDMLDILKQVKQKKLDKLIILCNEIDKNALLFAQSITNIKIIVYDKAAVYFEILKKYNVYPQKYITTQTNKKYTFKLLLVVAFNRKKAKNYLLCGLIFFVCSLFIRYSLYYIIMASLLFVFAIFSYFNKPFNLPKQSDW